MKDCEMFKKDIHIFASRPLLHDRMVLLHEKQNPNCKCNIKLLIMKEEKDNGITS